MQSPPNWWDAPRRIDETGPDERPGETSILRVCRCAPIASGHRVSPQRIMVSNAGPNVGTAREDMNK